MDGPHKAEAEDSSTMGAAGSTAGGSYRPQPHLVTRPVAVVAPAPAEPAEAAPAAEAAAEAAAVPPAVEEEEERSLHEQRAAARAEVLALEEEGNEANEVSPPGRVPTPTSAPIPIPGQHEGAAAAVGEGLVPPAKSVRFREEEGKGDGDSEPLAPPPRVVLADRAGLVVGSSEGLSGEFTPSYAAYTPSARTMHDLSYKTPDRRERAALAPPSSVTRPNIEDALRRVAVVLHKHISSCEARLLRLRTLKQQQQQQQQQTQRGLSLHRPSSLRRGSAHPPIPKAHTQAQGGRGSPTDEEEDEEEDGGEGSASEDEEERWADTEFDVVKMRLFNEEEFVSPQYLYKFVRVPIARPGFCYSMKQVRAPCAMPSLEEIYLFMRTLFKQAALSSECCIVCLIYVERLMERAHVPLVAITWRPVVLCGLLLASKVWQDLSSWNVEFASIYPQFSLQSINRLERLVIAQLQWDLYISSSLYAKYYFALRSLYEKKDFRRRYALFVSQQRQKRAAQQQQQQQQQPQRQGGSGAGPAVPPRAEEISARTGRIADDLRDLFSRSV